METEILINPQGAALLTLDAAIRDKTAPAQAILKVWISLARNAGLPADIPTRYRKAVAWGCTDDEVRQLADALHTAVPWHRAALAAGFRFKNMPGPTNKPAA